MKPRLKILAMAICIAVVLNGCGSLPPLTPGGPTRSRAEVWEQQITTLQKQVSAIPLPWTNYAAAVLSVVATGLHFFRRKSAGTNNNLGPGS